MAIGTVGMTVCIAVGIAIGKAIRITISMAVRNAVGKTVRVSFLYSGLDSSMAWSKVFNCLEDSMGISTTVPKGVDACSS